MHLTLTEAEKRWRKEVQEILARELPDELLARLEVEQGYTNIHSEELWLKMAQRGWLGLRWPREYGGQGRSYVEYMILKEEVNRGRVPLGTVDVFGTTIHFFAGCLLAFGTEEQKRRWLPEIAAGRLKCAIGITEPNTGSDAAAVELKAITQGDYYLLNGTKIFNHAHQNTHMFTVARTDPDATPKHRGISLFLVDLSSPGITISPLYTMGRRRRNEVVFEDVEVAADCLLGEENRGWGYMTRAMELERTQGQVSAGMERAFEEIVAFVRKATYRGRPLSQVPAVRHALGELATELEVARLLRHRADWLMSQGMDATVAASMGQLYSGQLYEKVVNTAMEVVGQYAQLESWGQQKKWVPLRGVLGQMYRDARTAQIGGGTAEIEKNIIALRGLGLPR